MTQPEALAILESGQSVLLTGAAGSGKTFLLDRFIGRAKAAGRNVAVTATTGLAATHLGGTTIHAWSGIGIPPVGFRTRIRVSVSTSESLTGFSRPLIFTSLPLPGR